MRRPRYLACAVTAVLIAPGPAGAASLDEALRAAYANNPNISAARSELEATNEGVSQARSRWRPTVTVNVTGGVQRTASQTGLTSNSGERLPRSGELRAEQPVYQGGTADNAIERARDEVRAQRSRLAATRQDVFLRAVRAYMNVWRDRAVVRLRESNVEVLRERLKATQERFDVGEVTRTDVAQAKSRVARALADRTDARAQLQASRARYTEVIGEAPADLSRPDLPGNLPENRQATVDQARADNPEVVAAEHAEAAARDNVESITGELYPRIDIVGSLQRTQRQTTSNSETDTVELFGQLTVPLFQRGEVHSRVREAKQRLNQRRMDVVAAQRTAEQEAVAAWEDLVAARSRIESRQQQVRTAETALEGVREENRVGERTVLDILDQEQERLNAQVDLVRAKRDRVVASYRLLVAVGDLTPGRLGIDAERYSAEARYKAVQDRWFGTDIPGEDEGGS